MINPSALLRARTRGRARDPGSADPGAADDGTGPFHAGAEAPAVADEEVRWGDVQRTEWWLLGASILAVFLPTWLGGTLGPAGVDPGRPVEVAGRPTPPAVARIDIRTAPWYVWTLLDGVGEVRARRIVEHRVRAGGFRSLEDLRGVPGLPRGWLARVREYLVCPVEPPEGGQQ